MKSSARRLRERLAAGPPILLDGALGTELERRGAPSTLPLWSTHALLHRPALVGEIHREYVAAGAEILTANTFRTQYRTLARAGLAERAASLCAEAVALARAAVAAAGRDEDDVWVAGSAPTLEDCYRPDLVPDDAALAREHAWHAQNLARAGADLLLCETLNTVREARAAATAARDSGLPFLVSFVCGPGAALLSGEPLLRAVEAVAGLGPEAILVNCLPLADAEACVPALSDSGLPWGVYANLGAPAETGGTGWVAGDEAPRAFAEATAGLVAKGARVLGGCCGTRPAHVTALAALLRDRSSVAGG